jgi:hypothetical protein
MLLATYVLIWAVLLLTVKMSIFKLYIHTQTSIINLSKPKLTKPKLINYLRLVRRNGKNGVLIRRHFRYFVEHFSDLGCRHFRNFVDIFDILSTFSIFCHTFLIFCRHFVRRHFWNFVDIFDILSTILVILAVDIFDILPNILVILSVDSETWLRFRQSPQ